MYKVNTMTHCRVMLRYLRGCFRHFTIPLVVPSEIQPLPTVVAPPYLAV